METPQFIKKYNKKKYINVLILLIILVSGAIIVNKCLESYDTNTNNPTIINDIEDFNEAMANDDYIEMEISDYMDLGSVTTERNGSTMSKTFYIGINMDNKMLVVSIRDDDYHDLVKNTDQSYLLRGKFSNITNNLRNTLEELLEDAISPEELDKIMYDDFLSCETPLDALTGKILILIFLFVMSLPFLHSLRKNSKGMRKLKKQHGSDFNMFCEKLDAEMKSPNALKQGAITITQNYIIANSRCTFFVLPIDELMWVYKGTITYYRIIRKTNITFVFGNKAKYQITSVKKINVDNIIKYFSQEEYKCIVGYSEEIDKLYRKQPDVLIDRWKNNDNQ